MVITLKIICLPFPSSQLLPTVFPDARVARGFGTFSNLWACERHKRAVSLQAAIFTSLSRHLAWGLAARLHTCSRLLVTCPTEPRALLHEEATHLFSLVGQVDHVDSTSQASPSDPCTESPFQVTGGNRTSGVRMSSVAGRGGLSPHLRAEWPSPKDIKHIQSTAIASRHPTTCLEAACAGKKLLLSRCPVHTVPFGILGRKHECPESRCAKVLSDHAGKLTCGIFAWKVSTPLQHPLRQLILCRRSESLWQCQSNISAAWSSWAPLYKRFLKFNCGEGRVVLAEVFKPDVCLPVEQDLTK